MGDAGSGAFRSLPCVRSVLCFNALRLFAVSVPVASRQGETTKNKQKQPKQPNSSKTDGGCRFGGFPLTALRPLRVVVRTTAKAARATAATIGGTETAKGKGVAVPSLGCLLRPLLVGFWHHQGMQGRSLRCFLPCGFLSLCEFPATRRRQPSGEQRRQGQRLCALCCRSLPCGCRSVRGF